MRGRREERSFVALPHHLLDCSNYLCLSAHAVKLLLDIYSQYRGNNNGDLAAPWSKMQPRGWRSRDTLGKALRELEAYGMIERARHGGEGKAGRKATTLWAVTWQAVDECDGKLDISARPASGRWRLAPLTALLKPASKTHRPTRPASHFDTPAVLKAPKAAPFDTPTVLIGANS
jgi:hypothetical protein